MNTIDNIKERFNQLQSTNGSSPLTSIEKNAFDAFNKMGIPTVKNEEWKYTRISSLFNKDFVISSDKTGTAFSSQNLEAFRLPGSDSANELVFVNGVYTASLSSIRSASLVILPLEEAARGEFKNIVSEQLGKSSDYVKDGIHALNTAFMQDGVFINIRRGQVTEHPIYIYNITDARTANILSQPRSLIYVGEHAQVQFVETFITLGMAESFTNGVVEVAVEQNAIVEYYKIQNDAPHTNQVSTTHFRQIGKSSVHTVTVSLNGGIVRNNLSFALEADASECHLYGLYFQKGNSHIDNHTVVDNIKPNCQSNELYKGIIDDNATAVFNGKIFVQQLAQKTNAFQSNKNILLSPQATVNTKPQLEIYADDVKCSHGCTVGQFDEEALFYLRSRGVGEKAAMSLLVHAFAIDVLERIKLAPIREYVEGLISDRLEIETP